MMSDLLFPSSRLAWEYTFIYLYVICLAVRLMVKPKYSEGNSPTLVSLYTRGIWQEVLRSKFGSKESDGIWFPPKIPEVRSLTIWNSIDHDKILTKLQKQCSSRRCWQDFELANNQRLNNDKQIEEFYLDTISGLRLRSVTWNQFHKPILKSCWLVGLRHLCSDKLLENRYVHESSQSHESWAQSSAFSKVCRKSRAFNCLVEIVRKCSQSA